MLVGVGDLTTHVVNQLLAGPMTSRLVLAGRDPGALLRQANLARFTAANLGALSTIDVERVDLTEIDRTAETLERVRPDIIFMGASLQSWRRITELPKPVFTALDEAQFGPWLPMHLSLNYDLARAVRASGITARVVNAAFPDAVNPILAKAGLAPMAGIGNVANIVPALTFGVAHLTGRPPQTVRIRLVAQHYFSHLVPRTGHPGNGAYHLDVTDPRDDTPIAVDHAALFALLSGPLKRLGGVAGQLLTAASASRVIAGLCEAEPVAAHVPGPNGLPGGYPALVSRAGIRLDLPAGLSEQDAIAINERCQAADGIERIDADGTAWFTEREMAVMRRMLGYELRSMALADCADQARELAAAYAAFKAELFSSKLEEAA
ncbi:hypothetical protein ATO4_21020 [Aurantimonas sp. 22II-16-19i]|nr:hypothetical protein ATO4_21020 [Aurantimonas sp. 22II-16-19i]